jgi:hypothetical protein
MSAWVFFMHDDVWFSDRLIHKFKTEIVPKIMKLDWVVEELESGRSPVEISDMIWKDYESWAEDEIIREKEEL